MRQSIRLRNYDYTAPGAYFVTICSHQRKHIFGEIQKHEMCLSEWGNIVHRIWLEIPTHHQHVTIDAFVVMPNHLHGVLIFQYDDESAPRRDLPWQIPTEEDARILQIEGQNSNHDRQWQTPTKEKTPSFGYRVPGSLGSVVGMFKSAVTRKINDLQKTRGLHIWQPNYYERVIRNDTELNAVRTYIENNPKSWADDEENA